MFGTKLRYLRKQLNITQQELGKKINIPQSTISDWENNKYLPDIDKAIKIAAGLDIPITKLLTFGMVLAWVI